jgi:hypothetical protein
MFQSVLNPDKLALLERWTDQADVHAKLNATRPPIPEGFGSTRLSARTTSITAPADARVTPREAEEVEWPPGQRS